mmetsp:Transcript_1013/g.3263  ORF Transcript_1013/g.3263 Transcript_1013/m.3263 type:complete len:87 (-) Transcript_1013:956-1216(-)
MLTYFERIKLSKSIISACKWIINKLKLSNLDTSLPRKSVQISWQGRHSSIFLLLLCRTLAGTLYSFLQVKVLGENRTHIRCIGKGL